MDFRSALARFRPFCVDRFLHTSSASARSKMTKVSLDGGGGGPASPAEIALGATGMVQRVHRRGLDGEAQGATMVRCARCSPQSTTRVVGH